MGRDRVVVETHTFFSQSIEQTMACGMALGKKWAQKAGLFCFFGDLGSGKTTLIKGFAMGAFGIDPSVVKSPTFTYLNCYERSEGTLYHFDLYRLQGSQEFCALGFEEYLFSSGLVCIEWSERIASLLPKEHIRITIDAENQNTRHIEVREVRGWK